MPPYNPYPPLPSFGPPAALPTPEPEGEYEQLYRAIQAEEAAKEKARIAAMPPRPAALTEGLAQLNENRGYADDLAPAAPRRAALTFDTLDPNNPEAARLAQMEQAYQEYGKVPEYRRSGGALGDIGKNIYSGGAGLLGAGAFLGEKMGFDTREFQEAMAERQQRTVAEMTPEMRLALQKKWVPGEGEGPSALGDWRAYAGTIAQSIPAMAAGFGLGGAAAKALQTGAMALKGGAALTRGQALATGTTGYSLGEGVVGSGFAGAEIANEIGDMNPEQLSNSPVYNELTKTMSHEEARDVLRDKASSRAMWVAGGLTALLGAPSGLFFTRMLTKPGIEAGTRVGKNQAVDLLTAPGRTRTGSAAKGAGFEALQEAGQGAGEVLGANLAKQEYVDPSQSLTEGMLENMVGGAVAGGAFGGALGAAAHRPPKRPFEELSANELEGHRQQVRLQLAELQKEDVGGTAIETSDTEAYKTAQVERLQAIGAELAAETERRSAPLRKLKDGALAEGIDRANARVQTLEAKLGEQDAERPVVRGQVQRARLQQELANARNAAEQGMLEQERRAQQPSELGKDQAGALGKSDEELLKEAQPEELQQLLTGVQQEVQDLRNFPERAETKIGQRRIEALTKMEEALQGEIMQREADNAIRGDIELPKIGPTEEEAAILSSRGVAKEPEFREVLPSESMDLLQKSRELVDPTQEDITEVLTPGARSTGRRVPSPTPAPGPKTPLELADQRLAGLPMGSIQSEAPVEGGPVESTTQQIDSWVLDNATDPELDALSVKLAAGTQNPQTKAMADAVEVERLRRNKDAAPASILAQPSDMARGGPAGRTLPLEGGPVGRPLPSEGGPVGKALPLEGGPVGGQGGPVQGGPPPQTQPAEGVSQNAQALLGDQEIVPEGRRQGEAVPIEGRQDLPGDEEGGRAGIEPRSSEGAAGEEIAEEALAGKDLDVLRFVMEEDYSGKWDRANIDVLEKELQGHKKDLAALEEDARIKEIAGLEKENKSLVDSINDWSSRAYKENKSKIETRDVYGEYAGKKSIGNINEHRRERTIEGLNQRIGTNNSRINDLREDIRLSGVDKKSIKSFIDSLQKRISAAKGETEKRIPPTRGQIVLTKDGFVGKITAINPDGTVNINYGDRDLYYKDIAAVTDQGNLDEYVKQQVAELKKTAASLRKQATDYNKSTGGRAGKKQGKVQTLTDQSGATHAIPLSRDIEGAEYTRLRRLAESASKRAKALEAKLPKKPAPPLRLRIRKIKQAGAFGDFATNNKNGYKITNIPQNILDALGFESVGFIPGKNQEVYGIDKDGNADLLSKGKVNDAISAINDRLTNARQQPTTPSGVTQVESQPGPEPGAVPVPTGVGLQGVTATGERGQSAKEAGGGTAGELGGEAPTEKLSPLDEWNAENIDRHPIAREKEVIEGVDEFVIPGLGYAEKGGKALSSATTGKVTGRTKWIPKNAWYTDRPKDAKGKYIMDEKYLENAWKKHKAGEKPLTPKQKDAVAYLVSVQQEYYRWRDDVDVALEEEGGFGPIDDEQATIAAMMDDANDIDEGATERAVIRFEDPQYNSKLINELQRIIESGKTEQQAATQGGSKGQKESTTERQQELLSEAPTKSEQELNAAKEEKEAKRNQGGKYVPQGEEDLLTGGKLSPREPDLFAEKKSKRRSDFLDIALTPLQEYFAAFDAFTAKRLEAAFIKKKGVDAVDWLIEKAKQKTVWSTDRQGRKISGTGLQELSIKDLWLTEDGLGEKLRKSMLKAIRATNKVGYAPHWMRNIQAGRDVFEDSTTEPRTSISKSTTQGADGGQTTTSLRAELVDRWGERLIKALERTGILRIEQSPGDTTGGGKGLYSTTAGVWDGKRMTLYADNIPKGDGPGVLVHEGGEHAGMEEMLGPQYADVSAQFDRLLKDGDEYAVAADASTRAAEQAELQAATARGASGSNLSSIMERLDRKRDSEHLAYLVQIWTNDKRNASKGVTALVRRILRAIRAWWYKSPMARSLARRGIKMDLRVEDIVALSEASLRRLASEQRKLPRAPMTRNAARPGPTMFNGPIEELGDLQAVGGKFSVAAAGAKPNELDDAAKEWKEKGTDSKYFKRWFGDSKVVDESGAPLVVYHYGDRGIHVFDSDYAEEGVGMHFGTKRAAHERSQTYDPGAGALSDEELQDRVDYSRGEVYQVYLKIENLVTKNGKPLTETEVSRFFKDLGNNQDERLENIKKQGIDGIVYTNEIEDQGSASYIVFDSQNIKSATDNRGTFDENNQDIRYSLANATKGVYDTIGDKYKAVGNLSKEDVVEASKTGKSKARSTARKGLLWVTTLGQIGDMFGNVFEEASGQNSLKELISATDAMDAQKNRLLHFAENTRRKWADLPRKKTDDLGGILLDATSKRVHPDRTWAAQQDDWRNQPDEDLVQAKRDYAVLNRRWEALGRGPKGKETQALYKEIVKQLDDQFKAAKQALLDRIDGTVTGAAEKARLKMVVEDTFKGLEIGPYFPLSRFGDHHALTWKEDANGEKFDYTRYAFRSEYEARQAVDRARKSGREAEYRVIGDYKGDDPAAAGGFAKDLIDKLNVEGLMEGKSGQELRDSIVQLSLQFAPDLSWSKHRIHRKRTPGWSTDAMRAYSQGTMSGAYHIARTANAWKMNKAVNRMSTVSGAGGRKTPQVAEEDVAAATMVTDRVQKLTDNNISPNVSPVAAAVNSLGFFWMLGISPAAAAVNLTQVPLVSLPYFASRVTNGSPIGLTRARRALGSAYKAFLTEGRKGIVDPDSLDLIKGNTQLSGDEQVVLKNLIENGKLNFTRARSLISNAEYGETSTPLQESFARIVEWSGGLFQRAEVINRYVTALAAVRLAPASASVNEKTDIATQALDTTQFDYSRANRAAIMRPNAMRVATQFMQFSQNMLYTLLRNSYNAVRKGATKDERSQARRMLAYLAGTHVMAGGLMALPFLSTAFAVANMLHDACPEGLCDDDEWDARVEFQNIIHDIVTPVAGEGGAEAARKGLINSALGIDVSSRVSLNDLLWRRPDPAAEGRDAWTHWAQEVAGPVFGGMASSFFMAARDIEQGETWRGTERLLPKGLKDILKASRFAEEGALNYAKDPLVEDFSPFVLGAQAAGFAPAELNLQYERAQAIKNRKTGIQRTRSRLMRSYALAVKLGFMQEQREIYKKIVKWNARHPMNKISSKNLAQSIRSRLRASSRRTAGQVLTPAMERAVLPEVRF